MQGHRRILYYGLIALLVASVIGYIAPIVRGGASEAAEVRQSAAPADGVSSFSFVVFGDNRPSLPGRRQPKVLSRIIDEINLLRPAFAVHVGDTIYGESPRTAEKEYADFLRVAGRLKARLYLAVGNHEVRGSDTEALFKRLLERETLYYSFNYGNSHFAVLDSEVAGQRGRITGSQLEWLKEDLHANRHKAHKFVFVHRPLFPVDGHIGSSLDQYPGDRARLITLLKAYNVDTVFAGHEHLYNKAVVDGLTEYICGGSGAPMYASLVGTGRFHHFLLVSVRGEDVTVAVIKPGNIEDSDVIIDEMAKRKRLTPALKP